MNGPCTTCRRTGICDRLPDHLESRIAFAHEDHKCYEPLAPARPIGKDVEQ